VSPESQWWLRVPGVLVRPRDAFLALRVDEKDDLDARQEPILLLTLLAGVAGVLLTSAWARLLDPGAADGVTLDVLTLVVLTFVAGALEGAAAYFVAGGALYLGVRGMGSPGGWRVARHVLAFACVPLALSVPLTLPVGLAAFGGDLFRSGGSDAGVAGDVYLGYQLLFVAWSLGLLVFGIRIVYGWTWTRAAGALGLLAVFLAGLAAASGAF
jgi:Yip1 domain